MATTSREERLDKILKIHGIAKERYLAFKEAFGLDPICDCDRRMEALIRFGQWFGGKARMAIESLSRERVKKACWQCGAPSQRTCRCGHGECPRHPHLCAAQV